MICIVCPRGCRMEAEQDELGHLQVTGAGCARGARYAETELTAPMRTVTTTVRVTGAAIGRLPVKSARPVPKELVRDTVAALRGFVVSAPVQRGTVIAADVAGTGVEFIATRDLPVLRHGIGHNLSNTPS